MPFYCTLLRMQTYELRAELPQKSPKFIRKMFQDLRRFFPFSNLRDDTHSRMVEQSDFSVVPLRSLRDLSAPFPKILTIK